MFYAFNTFTDIQVGLVKTKAADRSISPKQTAVSDAAYTPANTVWHLIFIFNHFK